MNETQHLIAIQTRLERIERLLKEKQKDNTLMTIIEAISQDSVRQLYEEPYMREI